MDAEIYSHQANESTPLNAKVLACQVVSVGLARCAVEKGHALRSPTAYVSRNDDARDPEAEHHHYRGSTAHVGI